MGLFRKETCYAWPSMETLNASGMYLEGRNGVKAVFLTKLQNQILVPKKPKSIIFI